MKMKTFSKAVYTLRVKLQREKGDPIVKNVSLSPSSIIVSTFLLFFLQNEIFPNNKDNAIRNSNIR